ncbi:MAG: hypothetical protein EAZ34_09220 [Polaromonas sp.]|nr:MAG: hypothetical protein EAZ34_09220 [Polaromonas sp.]
MHADADELQHLFSIQAGAAELASPGRRRSGPLGGQGVKQGPRNWLRQAAGAAAPSGGRELHAVKDRGGH